MRRKLFRVRWGGVCSPAWGLFSSYEDAVYDILNGGHPCSPDCAHNSHNVDGNLLPRTSNSRLLTPSSFFFNITHICIFRLKNNIFPPSCLFWIVEEPRQPYEQKRSHFIKSKFCYDSKNHSQFFNERIFCSLRMFSCNRPAGIQLWKH